MDSDNINYAEFSYAGLDDVALLINSQKLIGGQSRRAGNGQAGNDLQWSTG